MIPLLFLFLLFAEPGAVIHCDAGFHGRGHLAPFKNSVLMRDGHQICWYHVIIDKHGHYVCPLDGSEGKRG